VSAPFGRRLVVALGAIAVAAALRAASAAALCAAPAGGRVVLEADALDPDVFLWDSRSRLVDFAAGQWGNTRAIFAHTLLARPGTRATIVACIPAAAHPKFAQRDEDAVGVKLMSGPYRGRYGWVLSSDIHVAPPAGESAVLRAP
jgi:hypothetical protein